MLKTAAPKASYEKIKGRILKNQGFGGLRKFCWMGNGGSLLDDGLLMTKDQGSATRGQGAWPWPMAMAGMVAATLRVKYKIDFIFDSQGGATPFRVKYKIEFIFDSQGGRVESQAARRRGGRPPSDSNRKSI